MSKPERTYSISDFAQEFDTTTRAIRFYESEGLLAPARDGQKRIYTHADYVKLKLIMRGKRLGWTLAESRELIEMYDPSGNQAQYKRVLEKIAESRERMQHQLHEIEQAMMELDAQEKRVKAAMKKQLK
ncbi:MAG: MerR family DNA-binding transcriptional regulator [Oceanospirillaceae bacterium]|nr:MerR family DNA-binding transcriptional regulator [Oceanospirillaceae bacterium]